MIYSKYVKKPLSLIMALTMVFSFLPEDIQVLADNEVKVSIDGYQINKRLNAHRTVYSVETNQEVTEAGLIYGLKDYASAKDMVLQSTNSVVHSYKATENGMLSTKGSKKSYVMNMRILPKADYMNSIIYERAYAKLSNGSLVYGDVVERSVYNIADQLYQDSSMRNEEEHQYLYNQILKVAKPEYQSIAYHPIETTTEKVETTTETPMEMVEVFGMVVNKVSETSITVVWGQNAESQMCGQKYNVYVDNEKKLSQVPCGQYPLDNLTKGNHQIKVTATLNGKESNGQVTEIYMEGPAIETTTKAQEPTTKAPEPTTKAPEPTTVKETTTEEEITTENLPKNINLTPYYAGADDASSSSTGDSGHKIADMFDGKNNTKFYSGSACPVHMAWKMSRAVVVKRYSITTGDDSATYTTRNPYAWQLYGSNDGTTWTQIDIVKENGTQAVNFGVYTYETDIQEPYQYYQIQIEKNSPNANWYGIQMAELNMYGDVAGATKEVGGSLDYIDSVYKTANTINGVTNEPVENLFDGKTATKMFHAGTGSIAWKTNRETTLYSYTLTTANDNEKYHNRNPKKWTLYGSKDGSNWTKIDTVRNSNMEDKNYTPYTFTVDTVGTFSYYKMDISELYGTGFQLSEISMNGCAISPSEYDIMFTGDWDMIQSKSYVKELVKLFYNSYPRLYKRWGTGTEPKTITFRADKDYDGVAYCQGTTVCVSTTYANGHPSDIGFFSHEITHSVQQYGGKLNYGGDLYWWTENMANYGGFRYFHWSNPNYVQVYQASDTGLQDWGYQPYGNNKWFFAYMDYRYPTTRDANGNKTLGLIDSVNKVIKENNTGSEYSDNPYTVGSPINNVVKRITGYDCFEDLRKHYVQELQNGTWAFTGFDVYGDNWMTEDIPGVPNPNYPSVKGKTHGNKTGTQIGNVTSGNNLLSGAQLVSVSGFTNANESGEKLFDNNLSTKWCATSGGDGFGCFALEGAKHWIKIDLGSKKTFNTYTIYNTSSAEYGYPNMSEWELLTSDDGETWTSVDYQVNKNDGISSFDVGSNSGRYIALKVFNPGDSR
nr:discoidin domain-containing protein [Eubacterium sp.]